MIQYLLRRVLYALPILLAINVITFVLFFMVNTPDDMARLHLGNKNVTQAAVNNWKVEHGYQWPLFLNTNAQGALKLTETLFFQKSLKLFLFDFGRSDGGRDISYDISTRMWASLAIALPLLFIGLLVDILFAIVMVLFKDSLFDISGVVFCTLLMSISSLFYIIGGQFLFGKLLKWFPISGYDGGFESIRFVLLPIMVALISGLGGSARWYRTLFLEEVNKDYVKTARAKGLSWFTVLRRHILKNAMLPILTGIVVIIPSLFMGSLILESFFGVPGLGSYIIDAIVQQDFAIVRAMVFLGSMLYILGLILTDVTYTIADPRVRLS